MRTVNFTEFRQNASALLAEVERGERFVVVRHGKPVAEVSPVTVEPPVTPSWRRPGLRLAVKGAALSSAIREERSGEDVS
ncbi:MAG: type II toxin-antitoxin system Phd/YefM family antitoxin [Candidatus Hydrogenedentes bacterium]|nr:type II toxin-antitoxin system Phd/YefM family antitoxin [Candidatus Hydrogenedentota bacterium]